MSRFKYTQQEKEINRVLKHNQDVSLDMLNDTAMSATRKSADENIASAIDLLKSLGYSDAVADEMKLAKEKASKTRLEHRPTLQGWDDILEEASKYTQDNVSLEDLLTSDEINSAYKEMSEINAEFSRSTSIVNKTDLSFIAIATGLQVAKSLLFPYVAEKFDYGKSFNPDERLAHNDKSIETAHREDYS